VSVRAVAWDVDGTLVDSEPLHLEALLDTCRAHSVDISDCGRTPFVGVAIADVWSALASRFRNTSEREFRAAVTGHYLERAHSVRALPGAVEALELLARQGIVMAAVSNSERAIVDANLRAIGVRQLFRAVVTLDDVRQAKPAAEPYIRALDALGVRARQAWAVEDSDSGARSARAAGLRVLLVGAQPQAEGDHALQGLLEFPRWWQSHVATPGADVNTRFAATGVNG
jgi:HAD superfamily hydrolase (TIGR01509 family)